MDFRFTSIIFLLFCTPSSSTERQKFASAAFKIVHEGNQMKYTLCPRDEYVIGASIRTSLSSTHSSGHPFGPKTFVSSIAAIRMKCSDRIRGSSIAPPLHLGKYYETTSDWQSPKECPRGFVTGIFLYMSPKPIVINRGSEVDSGEYVRGIELLCREDRRLSNLTDVTPSSVQFGEIIGTQLGSQCPSGEVLIGAGVVLESEITFKEGENLFPDNFVIDCIRPTNLLVGCWIELEFESIHNSNCSPYVERDYSLVALMNNSTLGADADNITCHFSSQTGAKLNTDITNLDDIIFAYESSGITDLNGYDTDYLLFLKMAEPKFHQEWHNVVGVHEPTISPEMMWNHFNDLSDYNQNFTLTDASPQKTLTFANLVELRSRNKGGGWGDHQKDIQLTHAVEIEQLVGYCSVIKLYFPLVRKEVKSFIRETIGKATTIYEFV